jgi:hypothetical protein
LQVLGRSRHREIITDYLGEGNTLKLIGKIIIENRLVREAAVEDNDERHNFRDKLEMCLIDLCKELDIPVPLWLKKNTRELAIFRRTLFSPEQFMEKVWFDKFEIRLG